MDGCKIKCNVLESGKIDVNQKKYIENKMQKSFNIKNSFDQSLWQQKNDRVYRKPLLPWVASLSLVIFSLSFVNSRAEENVNSDDFVNKSAGNYMEFNLNRDNSGIFSNDVKNIGIGTSDPAYKLEVSGALMLEDVAMPDASYGHSGIYSSEGELYTLDDLGNSTKISSHGENGLWQYSSKNSETGKELEVEMESLTKELNRMLGGGYITENGEVIDKGENTISNLTLQTNKNVNTLEELQSSVDSNLKIINEEMSQYDNTTESLLSSMSNINKDANQKADLLTHIQGRLDSLESENESLINFFLAINPETLVYVDENGDLNLDGLLSAREISTEIIKVEKISIVSTDFSQSVGTNTITAGETEIFVKNVSIEEGDKVFITPNIAMKQSIAATKIMAGDGFIVSMMDSLDEDISFDWFIVNEVNNKSEEIVLDEIQ